MERYFWVKVTTPNNWTRTVYSFPTEQEAAESVWNDIQKGHIVSTFNNMNSRYTRWTYDTATGGIVGKSGGMMEVTL